VRELEELTGGCLVEPIDAGDAVAAREHDAGLVDFHLAIVVGDLLLDDFADLGGAHLHY
jgi:hypothetical protein